ncbi:MAG TPA: chaperone protein ClpB, partial [Balneola sp.]|nr:chaperone protein ClpB [Balneola sp.]
GDEYISSEHILIGFSETKGPIASLLKDQGVTKENILKVLVDVRGNQTVDDPNAESRYGALKK